MEDIKPIIYFLDDTPDGRRDLNKQLLTLFSEEFDVLELPLETSPEQYLAYLDGKQVAGVFIDQNLDETGEITGYTGVKLAGFIRSYFPALPIYLVTGHPIQGELMSEEAGDADSIVSKGDLITDSPPSLKFKKQFLRKVDQYDKALSETQHRFRDLLAKKFSHGLTKDEDNEYEALRLSREVPTNVLEDGSALLINEQLGKISELLSKVEEIKQREK